MSVPSTTAMTFPYLTKRHVLLHISISIFIYFWRVICYYWLMVIPWLAYVLVYMSFCFWIWTCVLLLLNSKFLALRSSSCSWSLFSILHFCILSCICSGLQIIAKRLDNTLASMSTMLVSLISIVVTFVKVINKKTKKAKTTKLR